MVAPPAVVFAPLLVGTVGTTEGSLGEVADEDVAGAGAEFSGAFVVLEPVLGVVEGTGMVEVGVALVVPALVLAGAGLAGTVGVGAVFVGTEGAVFVEAGAPPSNVGIWFAVSRRRATTSTTRISAMNETPMMSVHFDMMSSKLALPLNVVRTDPPPFIASPLPVISTSREKVIAIRIAITTRML